MENSRKVVVKASTEYAILIGRGILKNLGEEVKKRIQPCKAAVITDTTVEKLYAAQVEKSLQEAGLPPAVLHIPPEKAPSILVL